MGRSELAPLLPPRSPPPWRQRSITGRRSLPVLAYQLAIGLNSSEVIDFDEHDFTVPGPGTVRGIHPCFIHTGSLTLAGVVGRPLDDQGINAEISAWRAAVNPPMPPPQVGQSLRS